MTNRIFYFSTTSNIKNMNPNMLSSSIKKEEPVTFASIPSTSIAKKETIYQQHNQQKDSLLKPQLLQSKQNCKQTYMYYLFFFFYFLFCKF